MRSTGNRRGTLSLEPLKGRGCFGGRTNSARRRVVVPPEILDQVEQRELTQEEAARLIGCDPTTIGNRLAERRRYAAPGDTRTARQRIRERIAGEGLQ